MKIKYFIWLLAAFTLLCACNSNNKKESTREEKEIAPEVTEKDAAARGEHLVNAIGCHDCHTPKKITEKGIELDFDKLLAGHISNQALPDYDLETAKSYVLFSPDLTVSIGPWGTSFAANLTPDETGIGSWTETQFIYAIKNGKYKGLEGSRDLLPPMPWQSYRNLPDDDLKAIFAYLKSIRPIENLVPPAIPPQS